MPHFYEHIPDHLAKLSNREAVERYTAGAGVPGEGVAGLTRGQLVAHPVPGTWSIQQIVVHLMDTDLIASYRMKRIIAEDNPVPDLYDETAFAQRLFYHDVDLVDVCQVFRHNRRLTAAMLRRLPHKGFERAAQHPEVGPLTVGRLVRIYVHHVEHHMRFLRHKRAMVETT